MPERSTASTEVVPQPAKPAPDTRPGFRTELKVVAVVLAALALTEWDLRRRETRWSWDTAHVRSIPTLAMQVSNDAKPGVLFLGNSLFRCGIDTDVVTTELRARESSAPPVVKVAPSGSAVSEWFYYFNTYFVRAGRLPSQLVVGFANDHLADRAAPQSIVLGGYACEWQDTERVFAEDIPDFGSRVEYAQAMASASVTNRQWIRRGVFEKLIPGYRQNVQRMNTTLRAHAAPSAEPEKYRHLRRFLALAKESNVPLTLVAMPTKNDYAIDPQIEIIAKEYGARVLDCRNVESITQKLFDDPIHLNPEGARIFSRALVKRMENETPVIATEGETPKAAEVSAGANPAL